MEEQAKDADLECHINPKAAATARQDDCVGGGDECKVTTRLSRKELGEDGGPTYDGTVDPKRLSRREVVVNANKVVDPSGLLSPEYVQVRETTPEADQGWSEVGRASAGKTGQGPQE